MKRIINGKTYNTNTAKFIAEWWYGQYGNIEYCYEALYKKRTGEFFLKGEGGPLSKYGEDDGRERYGTIQIIPMTTEEARRWIEENGTVEEYIECFGEPEE